MNYDEMTGQLDSTICPDASFDIIKRNLIIGGKRAALYFVDGFIKDEVFEKMMEFFFKLKSDELNGIDNMDEFSKLYIPYVEADAKYNVEEIATDILSGPCAIMIDGIEGAIVIDTRKYPTRSIEQPEKDKTLRGSKDGFVETLIMNTALIRRRIRDFKLRMEYSQVGTGSKVDVAICYIEDKCDMKLVQKLKNKLSEVTVEGISMTQQAISEILIPSTFMNPFPKVKFTERPDYASACIMEGKIVLVMDNSPTVMILPTSFADFSKEANDYYFPPLTASFIRITRMLVSLSTILITPVVLLLINNPAFIPEWLSFIVPDTETVLPLFVQFLLLEFVMDGLRLASLNTPDNLSSSLSIIGALLLSDFAIQCGWFTPDAILYMAFVSIASFSQPSFEMGYAQKFMRIILLILVQLFNLYGLIAGIVFFIVVELLTKTITGRNYLYPVFPFNGKDFMKLFIRTKIK